MRFPPLKPGRCLLWIALAPDPAAATRYAALRAVLKTCRLHPLDAMAWAEVVIVEEEALRARLDEVRALLGAGDSLHLVTANGDRLSVESLRGGRGDGPPVRPPWATQ